MLIAGAGPAGLTLACELAVRGVEVRIVDPAHAFFGGSRADGIQPRTMEVFADLGVLDRIVAGGDLGTVMRAYQGDTVVWEGQMSEPTDADAVHAVPEHLVRAAVPHRGDPARTAGRARCPRRAVDRPGRLHPGRRRSDRHPRRRRRTEQVRARYLVGADGGRSTVRKRLGIAFPGETDESTTMMFADARVDGISHDHGRIWQVGDGGSCPLTPLAGTDLFVVVARPPQNADEPVRDYLQRTVVEASGRSDIIVREVTWHTTWRSNTRLAERFRDGRVFLVGDAGHVHPPTGGQGMNTGIQDGYNLGWKLAAALSGGRPPCSTATSRNAWRRRARRSTSPRRYWRSTAAATRTPTYADPRCRG